MPSQTQGNSHHLNSSSSPNHNDFTSTTRNREFSTIAIHPDVQSASTKTRPIINPIDVSSVYELDRVDDFNSFSTTPVYIYKRYGTPGEMRVANIISEMEGLDLGSDDVGGTRLFSSGMAAISQTLLTFLRSGSHLILLTPVYGGIQYFARKMLIKRLNIEVTFVPPETSCKEIEALIRDNTRVIFMETLTNPVLSFLDVQGIKELKEKYPQIKFIVDNTFLTPYIMQPLKWGFDCVIHSATKFLGGHTDIVAGVATFRHKKDFTAVDKVSSNMGGTIGSLEVFLLERSLKTLAARMELHSKNACIVAAYLEKQPKVAKVVHPSLDSYSWKRQFTSATTRELFGGMLSFEFKGGYDAAIRFVESMKMIHLAVSLGCVGTFVEHPASMTHGPIQCTPEETRAAGIGPGLVRMSIGLEGSNDLLKDIEQALAEIPE